MHHGSCASAQSFLCFPPSFPFPPLWAASLTSDRAKKWWMRGLPQKKNRSLNFEIARSNKSIMPNQQRTLSMNFRLSSDAETFANKHRPSMQIGAKRAKRDVCATCTHSDRASILHTTAGGWAGSQRSTSPQTLQQTRSQGSRQASLSLSFFPPSLLLFLTLKVVFFLYAFFVNWLCRVVAVQIVILCVCVCDHVNGDSNLSFFLCVCVPLIDLSLAFDNKKKGSKLFFSSSSFHPSFPRQRERGKAQRGRWETSEDNF